VQNLGRSAVKLVPADTEFAAMLVLSCARANPVEITKTTNLSAGLATSRNIPKRVNGFHTACPKMTLEEDETIMPMNEVIAKPTGIVKS
jgi:hypothetical protein